MEIEKILPKNGPSIQEVKKYIDKYLNEIIVIKCGGSVLLDEKLFNQFIDDLKNINVVKVNLDKDNNALSFVRNNIDPNKKYYRHIGIYAYQSKILKKIVNLKQSKNEIKSNLEQLRALDNGLKINVALAKVSPVGIDTMEDYLDLKKKLEYKT